MKIVTIKEKEIYLKRELSEFNNLADKPTEFIGFIRFLCKKYKLCLSKIAKCNDEERNLGVELLSDKILIQFFYEYDINTLELIISVNSNKALEDSIKNDIWTYIEKVTYKKGDRVLDNYGEKYILQEDIDQPSHTLKKYKAIRVCDNKESMVYNNSICPDLDSK